MLITGKSICLTSIAALLLAALPANAQSTYAAREDLLLDSLSTRKVNTGQRDGPHRAGRTGFWTTQGRLARNITNSTTWNYLSASITDADGSADAGGGNGGFSGWPGMDAYVRYHHMFPSNFLAQYYTEFTTMPNYGKGSTPNQKMMWAVACRLACETWGSNIVLQVSNAKYGYSDPTGRGYILDKCKYSVEYNFEERWSKHYLGYTLGPLRSIADLSTDPELRNRANMTWNWGWMDIASANFNGRWSLPAGRGSLTQDGNSFDIAEFGSWLMFSGPSPASLLDADQSLPCVQLEIPSATPPPVLPEMMDAATNRATTYIRRGLAKLFETQFQYSYVRPGYTLYSQFEGSTPKNADGTLRVSSLNNNGVPSNDWNSERWGLMWDDAPNYSSAGLNMKPPTSYGWCPDCGIGPYEDVVQHEGTIVGILNIPTNGSQFTVDKIPTNTLAVINDTATSGRLFLHYNNVLVSIFRTDPGVFQFPAPYSTFCDKRGFALETASPAEYPQATAADRLAAFRSDILAFSGVNTSYVFDATNRMIYTNRFGTVLDITYGKGGEIDDAPLDYEAWPLNESPWSYQQQMGNMFVFGKDRTLLWNYKNWTESTNNRPTITTTAQVVGTGGATVDVNLATRVSDAETSATNLLYRVLGATNCSAQLLPDGRTVRFTPAANFSGAGRFTFAAGDQFPHARQILHYNFEQANPVAGNSITDVSTVNRHAALSVVGLGSAAGDTNTPPALGTHSTKALRLTSSGVGSVRFSRQVYPASLTFANEDWTFATWFNRSSYADDDFIFYIGTGGGFGGSGDELQVYCPAQSKTVSLRHYATNNVLDVNLASAASVTTNEWHHLAVSFQRVTHRTGHLRLYLDGALSGVVSNVTWAVNQTGPIYFGGPAVNTVFNRNFSGLLDDVALWRGRFDDSDIKRLANGPAARIGGLEVTNGVSVVTAPLAPQGLQASLVNNGITLTWNSVSGATSYNVKRAASNTGPFTTIASGVTATNYTDNTAVPGVNYFYVVSAVNAAGESANSIAVSAMALTTGSGGGGFASWTRFANLSFPGYTRSETLTNFPLLVTLSTNIPGFSYAQFASPTGGDLRFGDVTGSTALSHEIEKWNANGASLVWVQVPRLTNGAGITMFWGNPAATTPPGYTTNGAVWTNGYVGVYHVNSATVADSAASPQNSSANSATATNGIVGGGLQFNGTSQFTTILHNAKFNLATNFEIQCWFKIAAADKPAVNDYRTLTSKQIDLNNRNWWIVMRTEGTLWWKSSASIDFQTSTDLANDQWHLMSAVHDGSTARLCVDGVEVATDTSPAAAETQTSSLYLGCEAGNARFWKGPMDEFRFSNVRRSSNWVWAVYQNIASNSVFNTIGAALSNAPSALTINTLAASGVTATTATLNGNLVYAGPSNAVVTVFWGASDEGTNPNTWANTLVLGSRTAGAFSTNLTGLTAGTTYAYRCFASNATTTAWAGVARNFTTPAAPPAGLGGIPANGQVRLAWSPAGSGSYQIKRSTTNGGPYVTQLASIVGTNFTDPNCVIGTTYYYVVNAVSGASASADSAQVTVSPVAAPTGVIASPSNAVVNLTWNTVAGATSYNMKRSATSVGPFTVIQSNVVGTSASDSVVTNGTNYFYVVSANSPGFGSADSAQASAMPLVTLPIPAGLVGLPANGGANLTWNSVANATTYNVKRATVSGGPYANVVTGLLAPNFTDSGLLNGSNYFYVVSASFGLSESGNSAQVTVTPAIPPTTFTNTAAGAWSAVTWTPTSQPIPDFVTTLVFNNGAAISSSNNLGFFLLNKLNLNNQPVTLAGDGLFFIGSNATVSASQNVAHSLANNLTLDGATIFSPTTNTLTVSGAINGSGGITKLGAGTLTLSGTNSFSGAVAVGAGVFKIISAGALGLNSSGTVVSNNTTLQLSGGITIDAEPLTITGSGTSAGGALQSVSGNNIWAGDITATPASSITRIGCDAGLLTIAGDVNLVASASDQLVLQGDGGITVTGNVLGDSKLTSSSGGSGVRTLAGDNTFTGQTDINGGTLVVNSINSVNGGTPALEASGLGAPMTVANGTILFGYSSTPATLRYTGSGETTDRVIDLAGSTGNVALDQSGGGLLKFTSDFTASGAGDKTLTLQGSGAGEIAGAIVNNSAANVTSVAKSGAGTWTLSGANLFTGNTTVSAGKLILSGSVAGSVVVNGGTFRGRGTVASNYTQGASAAMEVNLVGLPAGGASFDQLYLSSASSTVTLAGALNVVVTNELPTNVAFVIINNVGGAAVSGTFSGKPNNSIFAASQYNWRISYTGGSGNDVTLTALSSVLTPPNAPLNLTAIPASWRQIDLSWTDNSANEAGFLVERSLSAGGPFVAVGNVAANVTSFSDTTCAELTTYYYRVRAFRDFSSLSPSSNIASATTPLMPLIGYQAVITFTNYTRSEVLTNFPALVVLGTNVAGFDYNTFLAPTPDELRFKAADGTTDLDYEVETWDTAGQSHVWVKIPVFTNGCSIVARWGNPNVTDPPANDGSGAVWSNGFLGVWHLSETTGDHLDSSPNLAVARATLPNTQGTAAGMVGGADDFTGASGYVSLPDMGSEPFVTVECWANLNATPPDALRGLVSSDTYVSGDVHFRVNNALQVQAAAKGVGTLSSAANSIAVGNWFYTGYVKAGMGANNFRLFLNGNVVASTNGASSANLSDLNLAREYGGRYLNARMDEVRISNVPRSTNWLWATYQNIGANNAFNSYGSVATLIPTNPPKPSVSSLVVSGGQFQFTVNGTPGYIHTIQASTNLTTWDNVYQWTPLTMPVVFADTNLPASPRRFYGVVITP